MEKLDYEVYTSLLGEDCISRINNKEIYDLILIEDEMKMMNGISLLQKLKELNNKSKKIVLLEKEKLFISKHYIEDGFDDYINKDKFYDDVIKKLSR